MVLKLKSSRAKALSKNMRSVGLASILVRAIQPYLYSNRLQLYLHTYLLSVQDPTTCLRTLIYMVFLKEFLSEGL